MVNIDVVQLGSRRHYALPIMLNNLQLLRYLHTDIYCGDGSWMQIPLKWGLKLKPDNLRLKKLRHRSSSLPGALIKANNLMGLYWGYRIQNAPNSFEKTKAQHAYWRAFDKSVLRKMGFPPDILIGFRGCNTLFENLKGKSKLWLSQIDGGIHAIRLIKAEQRINLDWMPGIPDWLLAEESNAPFWLDIEIPRQIKEWELADLVICNSIWTQKCLEQDGVPAEKCVIIPLEYTPPKEVQKKVKRANQKLKVVFLGAVSVAKGIHALLRAAKVASETIDIEVHIAGVCQINPNKFQEYKDIAFYHGVLPKNEVSTLLLQSDVLVLPSVSDGFGMVQLEAMAHGLPVIASDHCGDVVREGKDGFVIPFESMETKLGERLVQLGKYPEQLAEMSQNALERVKDFSLEKSANRWRNVIETRH